MREIGIVKKGKNLYDNPSNYDAVVIQVSWEEWQAWLKLISGHPHHQDQNYGAVDVDILPDIQRLQALVDLVKMRPQVEAWIEASHEIVPPLKDVNG